MKVFVSYKIPLKHKHEDTQGNIEGHGYFDLNGFTEAALTGLEKSLVQAVSAQLEPQSLEPAGPPVFGCVAKLDTFDLIEEAQKRLEEDVKIVADASRIIT